MWHALFLEVTHYWFVGRAIKNISTGKWIFSLFHQSSVVTDCVQIKVSDVFIQFDPSAPTSPRLTTIRKLIELDYENKLYA